MGAALIFRGVRGSVPTTGDSFRRYGGNTACVELRLSERRRLIFDCGTGIRSVANGNMAGQREPYEFEVFLTHYHGDHLSGLPFFAPLYDSRCRFTFYGSPWEGHGVKENLESAIAPPWYPIAFDDTPSQKSFVDLDEAPIDLGAWTIRHTRLDHPQGVTAFRIDGGALSVVYATDCERGKTRYDDRFQALAARSDVLIHDAQYTRREYEQNYRGWGHSSWEQAIEAARAADSKRLILFHHDPDRDDGALDAMVNRAQQEFSGVTAAREGERIEL